MSKTKIAFQGELGAYSHIAANEILKILILKLVIHLRRRLKLLLIMRNIKSLYQ